MRHQIKEAVNAYWDAAAHDYDRQPGHDVGETELKQRWSRLLDEAAGGRGSIMDILDVGCGTGFVSLRFAEAGHRVHGIDQSRTMLAQAQDKARAAGLSIHFRHGDADSLPVPDSSVDIVAERHVLWTMADPVTTLIEWRRVLRPGGRLILIEGDWRDRVSDQQLSEEDPEFLHRYSRIRDQLPLFGGRPAAEIETAVTAAGFTTVFSQHLDERELWEGLDQDNPAPRYLVRATKPL